MQPSSGAAPQVRPYSVALRRGRAALALAALGLALGLGLALPAGRRGRRGRGRVGRARVARALPVPPGQCLPQVLTVALLQPVDVDVHRRVLAVVVVLCLQVGAHVFALVVAVLGAPHRPRAEFLRVLRHDAADLLQQSSLLVQGHVLVVGGRALVAVEHELVRRASTPSSASSAVLLAEGGGRGGRGGVAALGLLEALEAVALLATLALVVGDAPVDVVVVVAHLEPAEGRQLVLGVVGDATGGRAGTAAAHAHALLEVGGEAGGRDAPVAVRAAALQGLFDRLVAEYVEARGVCGQRGADDDDGRVVCCGGFFFCEVLQFGGSGNNLRNL